jgi:excisionase family DNA binding protein
MVGLHRQTIVNWCRAGRIESSKTTGGHWRIPVDAIEGLDEFQRIPVAAGEA